MKFQRIKNLKEREFSLCLELYERAFPIYERRLTDEVEKAFDHPDFNIVSVFDESDNFMGVIMFWQTERFVYIEHFTVAENFRGCGVGTKILKDFIADFNFAPIILEIEPPIDEPTKARKRFYQKLGFTQLDVKHMQIIFHEQCPEMELKILSKPQIDLDLYGEFRKYLDETVARFTS